MQNPRLVSSLMPDCARSVSLSSGFLASVPLPDTPEFEGEISATPRGPAGEGKLKGVLSY